ncbi:uroporphyrinogen decarboxylase [Pelagibacterales bacterium SAG-MED17]|nr:uroporphyrinogen decarboxylase [Pelagibacterales bacterium SAG-MED17]
MSPITNCIKNKDTKINPIWLMRQAGRYLPEFREIRKENQNFIKLCLNSDLASEITLQPIKRFGFDGAVIFSDILMLPYGIGQRVEFEKNYGPKLGDIEIEKINKIDEINFTENLSKVYEAISKTSKNPIMTNRDMIGFVGAPWTILVYMINKSSPKKGLSSEFYKDDLLINKLLTIIDKFLKLHIKNQVDAGAKVIQIFDSWAGLLENEIPEYIYEPTLKIVEYVKQLGVPVICFPRGIKDYKNFCEIVKPDAVNIDYDVDPKKIIKEIKIPIQGGLDPTILLTDQINLKNKVEKYLSIFKDHPYIFNLGHGILPETKIEMVENLINIVRNFK